MTKTKVVFRADGNSDIGLGHVIRSLALAEMLKGDFECIFAIQDPNNYLKHEIEKVCSTLIILPISSVLDNCFKHELDFYLTGKEIVILDGYAFGEEYQRHVKDKAWKLVCIDDIHAFHFVADVIINHGGGVTKNVYSNEEYTHIYLGPEFALLRSPFLKKRESDFTACLLKSLFINMGGADPKNDLAKVLVKVSKIKYFEEFHIVTGSAYQQEYHLKQFLLTEKRAIHYKGVKAEQMANIMQKCGVAICPPSSVSYEYASINGLLFLKQIAENQADVKKYFIEKGLAFDFDTDFKNINYIHVVEIVQKSIINQNKIFDRLSGERLKEIFKGLKYNL